MLRQTPKSSLTIFCGKRAVAGALVAPLILLLFVHLGAPGQAADEIVIFDNNNPDAVKNGPPHPCLFRITKRTVITRIRVYHWNGGKGAVPGWMRIHDHKRKVSHFLGKLEGEGMRPGGRALYWEWEPNADLEPGEYELAVSSPGTWSWNAASKGMGIATIRGRRVGTKRDPPSPDRPTPPKPPAPPASASPPSGGVEMAFFADPARGSDVAGFYLTWPGTDEAVPVGVPLVSPYGHLSKRLPIRAP